MIPTQPSVRVEKPDIRFGDYQTKEGDWCRGCFVRVGERDYVPILEWHKRECAQREAAAREEGIKEFANRLKNGPHSDRHGTFYDIDGLAIRAVDQVLSSLAQSGTKEAPGE